MTDTSKVVFLDQAEWLEFHPSIYRPVSGDEKLAAVVGYMIGDGAIALRTQKYTKRSGEVSTYAPRMVGAFYSNCELDLLQIHENLIALGIGPGVSVTKKKPIASRLKTGYQLQLAHPDCEVLVESGVPVGKKTIQTFEVPRWVMAADLPAKRAFVAALFGAEGSTPSVTKGGMRTMRPITMTMCKIAPTSAGSFFTDIQQLLTELGVESSLTATSAEKFGKPYVSYTVRICGIENIIAFCANVSYVFCDTKATLAWQWLQYLRAYQKAASTRRDTVLAMAKTGARWEDTGAAIGITGGAANRLHGDILAGKGTTAGHRFPEFQDWMHERWDENRRLLRLKVVSRAARPVHQEVWNLLVSSHDHSYLLANGANNFNSFETMSGRVYHAFDRTIHLGNYPFNPKLPIWVGQDFNIDPMSSVIMQPQPNGEVWIVDELVLFGSNTQEVAEELSRRYFKYFRQLTLYPDPAGAQRAHTRGETDLDILREAGFNRIKFRRRHPKIADRVNAVNRVLKAADGETRLRIDQRCKTTINGFEQTIYKPGTREVDKSMGVEHIMDALGYCLDMEYPIREVVIMGVSV